MFFSAFDHTRLVARVPSTSSCGPPIQHRTGHYGRGRKVYHATRYGRLAAVHARTLGAERHLKRLGEPERPALCRTAQPFVCPRRSWLRWKGPGDARRAVPAATGRRRRRDRDRPPNSHSWRWHMDAGNARSPCSRRRSLLSSSLRAPGEGSPLDLAWKRKIRHERSASATSCSGMLSRAIHSKSTVSRSVRRRTSAM
jgi:hypothetical protein